MFRFIGALLLVASTSTCESANESPDATTGDASSDSSVLPDGAVAEDSSEPGTDATATGDAAEMSDAQPPRDAAAPPGSFCPPLPPATQVRQVGPGESIADAVASASVGDTIVLADGEYNVGADPVWIRVPQLTIRGSSDDASAVVIDSEYQGQRLGRCVQRSCKRRDHCKPHNSPRPLS